MKTYIVYDSIYGNTGKIAKAVASGIRGSILNQASAIKFSDLKHATLLIVGSPVHGGQPTTTMKTFLDGIPANALKHIRVAAFDTRMVEREQGVSLRLLMKVIRYAAEKMAEILEAKGGKLITKPQGFYVSGREGPLKQGELERAEEWGKSIKI